MRVCVHACVCVHLLHNYAWTLVNIYIYLLFLITFSISMYIMCVCLFSALRCRVGALQISIIIIIKMTRDFQDVYSKKIHNTTWKSSERWIKTKIKNKLQSMFEQQNANLDLNCWSGDEYKTDIITDADISTDQKWPSHHMGIATIPGLYMLSWLVQACRTWKASWLKS